MIKVYFQTKAADVSELVAVFDTEELYNKCSPALEKMAEENRMIVTESCDDERMPDHKRTYFLFSSNAVEEYEETGTLSEDFEGELISFGPEESVTTALACYDGWHGYMELSESEYDKLDKAVS